jgi:hypothetical protein
MIELTVDCSLLRMYKDCRSSSVKKLKSRNRGFRCGFLAVVVVVAVYSGSGLLDFFYVSLPDS